MCQPSLLSPAQLIETLLRSAPPAYRSQVLHRARYANRTLLDQLQVEKLHQTESGWADHWQQRFERTTQTLAEIERALATC